MKEVNLKCDVCGEPISVYGTGWAQDDSLVIITARIVDAEFTPQDEYHLHHICYHKFFEAIKKVTHDPL